MKIDSKTLNILSHLNDGKTSLKQIAKELSIAENTVRTRVNKMMDKDILRISGLVDITAIPGHMLIMVAIRLKTMDTVGKCEELSRLHGVISASVVTGRYDIILIVTLNETFSFTDFFKGQLDPIEDILSAETFVAYKSHNLYVPYIL